MSRDNSNLAAKLELRRHFLRAYHPPGQRRVIDCCQATGRIWSELVKEFKLDSYWGLDIVPKKGRLRVDSARVLAQPGWRADVVDIDAYGSPWAHWVGLLATASWPVTVFLTWGSAGPNRLTVSKYERKVLGIGLVMPVMLWIGLRQNVLPAMLALALERFTVRESVEAFPCKTARYFGLRLEPLSDADGLKCASRPQDNSQ